MASDERSGSRLPVILIPLKPSYEKPERRNHLVPSESYDKIDATTVSHGKMGTDGRLWVGENAFPGLLGLSPPKAAYVFENQIQASDKLEDGGDSYAHSSAVVALLDKKSQETTNADTQAKLQYARDTLINASDSDQAQNLRRKRDTFTDRELPKLRKARGGSIDELTGEPLGPGAAFHHVQPREIHTSPEDALDPGMGRLLNRDSHIEVHKEGVYDEKMFAAYKAKRNKT